MKKEKLFKFDSLFGRLQVLSRAGKMNPMLDGGQFLFILFEEVIGTPINMKLKVALFNLSYMFILALFIFVVYNDLMRIF